MTTYLFKNGGRISPDKAESVDFFSSEQLNVFESIRTYNGRPFKVEEHLKRLGESAKTVGLELPTELEHIKTELNRCLNKIPKSEYFIRITVTSDAVLILFVPGKQYPPSIYKKGVKVVTVPTVRNPVNSAFPPAKSSNFLNQILGTLDPVGQDAFEIMFKAEDGTLQEARTWNFFIVKDGVLKTPPRIGLLGGVTRKFVIELAAFLHIPFEETPITRHEVYNADEVYLTNTSGETVPACEWDGRRIRGPIPGRITQRIQREYRKRTQA